MNINSFTSVRNHLARRHTKAELAAGLLRAAQEISDHPREALEHVHGWLGIDEDEGS